MSSKVAWVLVVVMCLTEAVFGAQPAARVAFTEVEKAGADFPVQGEYVGEMTAEDGNKRALAAQVIALGEGKFKAVFLPGGLPGDGWDGTTRFELDGKTENNQTTFPKVDAGYEAVLNLEGLVGQTDKAEKFTLAKVTRKSPTLGAKPPEGAVVLFDGTDTGNLTAPKIDARKLLGVGTSTKRAFGDFTMHVEFMTPFMPTSGEQGRGNSGVYLQGRYEVQILDSFGRAAEFNGCGSLYRQVAPTVNLCYPPLQWQTFDIDFTAAKFEGGKKVKNAVITLKHNGVVVHDKVELKDKTGAGKPEGPLPQPTLLQNHNDPVFFQNVWLVEKK